MASNSLTNMADRKVTDENLIDVLESGLRPVWSATHIADNLGITRQTAQKRLKELESKNPNVQSLKIGQADAYFVPGTKSQPYADSIEERHKLSIIQHFTDEFMGLYSDATTAIHPNDGRAEAGDRIQFRVEGQPGSWGEGAGFRRHYENKREKLEPEEIVFGTTQALVSGTLYEKPTAPICEISWPDDYDLELNMGGELRQVEGRTRPIFVSGAVKNYMLKAYNDAVFLTDVNVDWISPIDEGTDIPTYGFEEVEEEISTEDLSDEEILRKINEAEREHWEDRDPL